MTDTVAFVQEWMMSSDHVPTQWDRDFAAAIDAHCKTASLTNTVLPDIEKEGEALARDTYRHPSGMYLWCDLAGAIQTGIAEERERHVKKIPPKAASDTDPAYGVATNIVDRARAIIVRTVGDAARRTTGDRKWLQGIADDVRDEKGAHMPTYLAMDCVIAALKVASDTGAGLRDGLEVLFEQAFADGMDAGKTGDESLLAGSAAVYAQSALNLFATRTDATDGATSGGEVRP